MKVERMIKKKLLTFYFMKILARLGFDHLI